MSSQIASKFITFQILPLFVGSWLALIFHSYPAQAQINNHQGILQAQGTLPPPPNVPGTYYGQQPLPQLQPYQPGVQPYYPYEQNLQPAQPGQEYYEYSPQPSQPQYNQNWERYLVYVESNNYQTLQQIKQIEPGAYIRQYRGRSVIQSGVFSRPSNAQDRVRQLQSYGIYGAQIVNFNNGQEVLASPAGGNVVNPRGSSSRYYVVVPTSSENLNALAEQVIRSVGQSSAVLARQKPLGPHVAVGPFAGRKDATQWNNYLRNLGFGDARVYYGN
ncbi:hypothetical protein I8751_28690 [Nostocaceae cyanobacterium CENA357]|uniref:SPOR domain-containing protein n=1 Tax=Atlanticothrix silvestris CENA357 TaxID=1725252 RepID=A0A8J7HIM2_9CYAN|nr:hypothetical protein [Atlanticothrix silvestris]MBH8556238.1 hypothetical protein [Atlanticothrix silvestris CENA357]